MNQNPFQNILYAVVGIFLFLLLFRVSLAFIGVFILAGAVFFLGYGIYYLYQQAVRKKEALKFDEEGRRIIQASVLEMKDSEEGSGEASKPH